MEKFLENYIKDIKVKEVENGFDLVFPFAFYTDILYRITLHLQKNEKGMYNIDDKGFVCRYLNNLDVNLTDKKYQGIAELICDRFSLKIENNIVKSTIGFGMTEYPAERYEQMIKENLPGKYIDLTYVDLHKFLQGLTLLSVIKWF